MKREPRGTSHHITRIGGQPWLVLGNGSPLPLHPEPARATAQVRRREARAAGASRPVSPTIRRAGWRRPLR